MRLAFILACLTLFFSLASCSSSQSPTSPGNPYIADETPNDEISASSDQTLYPGVFGAWKVRVDLENLTAELIPARNAGAIGNIFDSDLLQFLTHSPCSNCLRIGEVKTDPDWDELPHEFKGRLHVTFLMQHPFANITTRPDLHGFDVRLIIIGNSDIVTWTNPNIRIMRPDTTTEDAALSQEFIQNPDGYTSHYDGITTDSRYFIGGADNPWNLNPFFRFFEDPEVTVFDPHSPDGHNVMPVGSSIDQKTVIFSQSALYTSPFEFYAVADVAYGQSAVLANRTNPQYYLPAFHRTEPWRVEYWIENNDLSDSNPLSTADVVVQVFDWQQGTSVDPDYPDPSNLTGIPESSNVARLELSARSLMDSEVVIVTTPEAGTGTPTNPLRYRLQVRNITGAVAKVHVALLAVRDELYGHASPSGRWPVPPSPAGFPYDTLDIVDYSLYHVIFINQPNRRYFDDYFNNELEVEPKSMCMYSTDRIYATFFMDWSHTLFTYEWDYDFDGISFNVESTGMPSEEVPFTDNGLYHVGLRVRTNSIHPREYVYSIPVYYGFMGGGTQLETVPGTVDTTYQSGNNAVAMTDDHYYVVFTSEAVSGQRDIWLGVGDKNVIFTTYNLTDSVSEACYNPSVAIIEEGDPFAGVYVAYSNWNSGDPEIYSTSGNLDGTGFAPANILLIHNTAGGFDAHPCIVNANDRIYCYFQSTSATLLPSNIVASELNVTFSAWVDHGVIDATRNAALNPDVIFLRSYTNRIYCVFEDATDLVARGTDLYLISSTNPASFTSPSINISTFPDDTNESSPSLAGFRNNIAVAYLADDPTTGEPTTFMTIIPNIQSSGCFLQYKHLMPSGFRDFAPAVSTANEGHFILATSSQTISSGNAWCYVSEIILDINSSNFFSDHSIYSADIGTVPASAGNAYPGIASRIIDDYAGIVESFIVCRTFEDGRVDSPTPFSMQFGNVIAMYTITMEIED